MVVTVSSQWDRPPMRSRFSITIPPKVRDLAQGIGGRALDLILPPACVACESIAASPGGLCPSCWNAMRWIERPYCEVLGAPLGFDMGEGALSPLAIAKPPPFERARAAVMFDDLPRALVHRLKYRDDTSLARWMAPWMARAGHEEIARADLIVPVPLHRTRLLQRRFNQSAELSRALARYCAKPHAPDVLVRRKPTRRQVGLGHAERQRNVQGAFVVPDAMRPTLAGKSVLLVDDVLTTGATVSAATRGLKRGGAAGVDVLTFARVDHGDDGTAFVDAMAALEA